MFIVCIVLNLPFESFKFVYLFLGELIPNNFYFILFYFYIYWLWWSLLFIFEFGKGLNLTIESVLYLE